MLPCALVMSLTDFSDLDAWILNESGECDGPDPVNRFLCGADTPGTAFFAFGNQIRWFRWETISEVRDGLSIPTVEEKVLPLFPGAERSWWQTPNDHDDLCWRIRVL